MSRNSAIEQLQRVFSERALEPETLFLLRPTDALEFIDAGKTMGLKLAGVEGFLITPEGAYQPTQEFSNDCADSHVSAAEFEVQTQQLIQKGASAGIWFEVVFESE